MSRNISEICLEIGKIVKRSGASPEACNKVDDLLVEINEARNEENSFWRKQMEAAYERGKSNFWKKQLEDMQEKTRLIDANAFIRSLDNYEGKPFTPGLCATLVELFPATCDTEAYLQGRADQKHEDLDAQVILTKHEIEVLETSLIKKILTDIESRYDLNHGEIILNPRDFYDLVEGFYPTIVPPTKDEHDGMWS